MTFVVNDGNNGEWHFHPELMGGLYQRVKDGAINARIKGEYLPEPILFKQQNGRDLSAVPKALWEHWNAYINN